MTCKNNYCRGTALIGDSCMGDADCQIGTCCTSGPNAGKCASSC
jgi:hypothetical protein